MNNKVWKFAMMIVGSASFAISSVIVVKASPVSGFRLYFQVFFLVFAFVWAWIGFVRYIIKKNKEEKSFSRRE